MISILISAYCRLKCILCSYSFHWFIKFTYTFIFPNSTILFQPPIPKNAKCFFFLSDPYIFHLSRSNMLSLLIQNSDAVAFQVPKPNSELFGKQLKKKSISHCYASFPPLFDTTVPHRSLSSFTVLLSQPAPAHLHTILLGLSQLVL